MKLTIMLTDHDIKKLIINHLISICPPNTKIYSLALTLHTYAKAEVGTSDEFPSANDIDPHNLL